MSTAQIYTLKAFYVVLLQWQKLHCDTILLFLSNEENGFNFSFIYGFQHTRHTVFIHPLIHITVYIPLYMQHVYRLYIQYVYQLEATEIDCYTNMRCTSSFNYLIRIVACHIYSDWSSTGSYDLAWGTQGSGFFPSYCSWLISSLMSEKTGFSSLFPPPPSPFLIYTWLLPTSIPTHEAKWWSILLSLGNLQQFVAHWGLQQVLALHLDFKGCGNKMAQFYMLQWNLP